MRQTARAAAVQRIPEFTTSSVLTRSLPVWLSNLPTFLGVALLVHAPMLMLAPNARGQLVLSFLLAFIQAFLALVVAGTLLGAVFAQLRRERRGIGEAFQEGMGHLTTVVLTGLLQSAVLLALSLVLVAPGVVAFCRYWVAMPAALVDRLEPGESLGRSTELTEGYRSAILGLAVVFGLGGLLLTAAPIFVGTAGVLIQYVATAGLSSFHAVAVAVGYYQLRAAREGLAVEDLAMLYD